MSGRLSGRIAFQTDCAEIIPSISVITIVVDSFEYRFFNLDGVSITISIDRGPTRKRGIINRQVNRRMRTKVNGIVGNILDRAVVNFDGRVIEIVLFAGVDLNASFTNVIAVYREVFQIECNIIGVDPNAPARSRGYRMIIAL